MHPLELLRHLARFDGAPGDRLAVEAAIGLAELADNPAEAVLACRRLTQHHPVAGPVWVACAVALTSVDPRRDLGELRWRLQTDDTPERLPALLEELDVERAVVVAADPHVVAPMARAGIDTQVPSPELAVEDLCARLSGDIVVVVEALIAGPTVAIVPQGGRFALQWASEVGAQSFLVIGEARSVDHSVERVVRRSSRPMGLELIEHAPSPRGLKLFRSEGPTDSLTPDHQPVPELTEVQ